jgi:hypothetical protein
MDRAEFTIERYVSRRKKPGPMARARAKRRRAEYPVATAVRLECVNRDGSCRFAGYQDTFGPCEGLSEWMHLAEKKRARTRGMKPKERHTTAGSMMGCAGHHGDYDKGAIELQLGDDGADGLIAATVNGHTVLI